MNILNGRPAFVFEHTEALVDVEYPLPGTWLSRSRDRIAAGVAWFVQPFFEHFSSSRQGPFDEVTIDNLRRHLNERIAPLQGEGYDERIARFVRQLRINLQGRNSVLARCDLMGHKIAIVLPRMPDHLRNNRVIPRPETRIVLDLRSGQVDIPRGPTIPQVLNDCCSGICSAILFPFIWVVRKVMHCVCQIHPYQWRINEIRELLIPPVVAHHYRITDPNQIDNTIQRLYAHLFATSPLENPEEFSQIIREAFRHNGRFYIIVYPQIMAHKVNMRIHSHAFPISDNDWFTQQKEVQLVAQRPLHVEVVG